MNDLVSKGLVKKAINNYFINLIEKGIYEVDVVDCNAELCIDVIDRVKIAYDVGEIVSELKNLKKCYLGSRDAEMKPMAFDDYIQEIIDFVKGDIKDE